MPHRGAPGDWSLLVRVSSIVIGLALLIAVVGVLDWYGERLEGRDPGEPPLFLIASTVAVVGAIGLVASELPRRR